MKHYIGCPVCGEPCEVKPTKRDGFFYDCSDCILRVFVNGKKGVKRLRKKWETVVVEVV